jgi:hypothetical protein
MDLIPMFSPATIELPSTPYTLLEDGTMRSFCRGPDKTDGRISGIYDSISSYWVNTITGEFDQDISSLWVGPKGSGKSSAVLSVCIESAKKVADWKNDGSKWNEYYNLHELTACILEEEATKLMNIQRKHVIKNFDDIGIGWNARSWQDDENMQKNDIFQINRTDSAIQCFSVPNQFLLDKVPRSLVSHYVEMDMRIFEKGYTTIKLFKPKTMFREGKIINPFLVVNRNKFVNYIIPKPEHEIWQEYKALRNKNKEIAIHRRNEYKNKKDEQKTVESQLKAAKLARQKAKELGGDPSEVKKTFSQEKHEQWEKWFVECIPEFEQKHTDTGHPWNKCLSLVLYDRGFSRNALSYWRQENFIDKYGVGGKK